jgi:hypothetical protein
MFLSRRLSLNKKLLNRTQSGFPVSIGTGLSLETIFKPVQPVYDKDREVPSKIDPDAYTLYLFNVSTLLRNLVTSIDAGITDIPALDIYEALMDELVFLEDFFTSSSLDIKFYVNSYEQPKKLYPDRIRVPKTANQLVHSHIKDLVLKEVVKESSVTLFTDKVTYGNKHKVLIFTHMPWDLLSYEDYVKLDLLESHTGVIKTRKDFNTKYFKVPNRDMDFLPFSKKLLPIFGDKVMFKPSPLKERVRIYDLLKSKHVHPLTSDLTLEFLNIK